MRIFSVLTLRRLFLRVGKRPQLADISILEVMDFNMGGPVEPTIMNSYSITYL